MKSDGLLVALCVLTVASSTFAETVTFEGIPTTYWENGAGQDLGGFIPGVTFGSDVQITTSSTVFPAHSGNLELTLADLINPIDISLSGVMSFKYNVAQPDVSFWYTSEDGFTAKAYDANGNLLGFANGNPNVDLDTLQASDSLLDFGFGGISSVSITDDGGLGQFFTIDDLSLTNPVPDAANTLALFGVTTLGMLTLRRKIAA